MSFPRYPKYKDSGVEWLGEVPEHWELRRLKFLCDIQTGDKDTENAVEGGLYPFFVRSQTIERINSCAFDCEAVLTAGDGVGVGKVFHYHNGPFDFHQRVYMLNKFRQVSGPFLFHFLRENFYKVALEGGAKSTVDSLRRPLFMNFTVSVPPAEEQRFIVEIVERESAKIDELVAEQRRLIELLKEKRQAVISHAVTKGLDPHATKKPSGIEWLGEVPEYWEVVPLKYLCVLLKDGTHLPPGRVDEGVPLLSVRNIVDGRFVLRDDDSMISEESYQELCRSFVPHADDVLLAIVGATLGKTAIIPAGLDPFHIQRSLAVFRTRKEVIQAAFLNLVFQSHQFQSMLWELVGYSAQPGIYLGTLQNLRIPIPPLKEQGWLLEKITSSVNELTSLTAEAQRAIDLLQERRTALISAAVTGKIDVRGLAETEAA
jgi:type I restriction enzyme S subunit